MHNTKSGSVFGTPCYMAPEQCEGKVQIDHRADIYSLGVILFEMLTGKVPFGGTGFGEIIVKHMTVEPPSARSLVPDLPPALDAVLFRALAKDPAHRFQSMAELRAALLNPTAFAGSRPELGPDEELWERFRTASPMARTEISLRSTRTPPPPSESGSLPAPARSTFNGSTGEIRALDVEAIPRARYGRKLAVAAAVVAAVVVIQTAAYRRPVASLVAAAQSLSRPATVRLNFGSDPDGATVVRSDGVIVGTTPLSTEVPYADVATEFVVRKPGYVSKTVSLVPNLPSPVFAVLQAMEPPAPPPVVSAVARPTATAPSPASRATRRPAPVRRPSAPALRPASLGDDEILPPTVY
jgi:serine/threonine-protein kinase